MAHAPGGESSGPKPSWCVRCGRRAAVAWHPIKNVKSLYERHPKALLPLDGVRGLAVLWVVLYHCWLFLEAGYEQKNTPWLGFAAQGEVGVDLFFTLSGFLMHFILTKELAKTNRIRIVRFLARRWLRLWPAYLAIALLYLTSPMEVELCTTNYGCLWNFLMLNDLVGGRNRGFMAQTWSISVEFQFYLVSPFVVWAMYHPRLRSKRYGPIIVPGLLIVISNALRAVILWHNWGLSYLSPDYWIDYTAVYARIGPYGVGMITSHMYGLWLEDTAEMQAAGIAPEDEGEPELVEQDDSDDEGLLATLLPEASISSFLYSAPAMDLHSSGRDGRPSFARGPSFVGARTRGDSRPSFSRAPSHASMRRASIVGRRSRAGSLFAGSGSFMHASGGGLHGSTGPRSSGYRRTHTMRRPSGGPALQMGVSPSVQATGAMGGIERGVIGRTGPASAPVLRTVVPPKKPAKWDAELGQPLMASAAAPPESEEIIVPDELLRERRCCLGWRHFWHALFAIIGLAVSEAGPFTYWSYTTGMYPASTGGKIATFFWFSLARTLYGASVAYFMFQCLIGGARFLNAILISRPLAVVARLSYTMYLIQFLAIIPLTMYPFVMVPPDASLAYLTGRLALLSVMAIPAVMGMACVAYLVVERPFMLLR